MGPLKVLVIGYNAFDVLLPFSGLPIPDSKHEVDAIHMGGGGPGATAAVALSRLGADVTLITPLCGDLSGLIQEEELRTAGVNLDYCPRYKENATPKAVILVDKLAEERTILWTRGLLPEIEPIDVDVAWLKGMDLLYCDGHETRAAIKLAKVARKQNLPVIMDAGSVREGSRELVCHCTDVISSRTFALSLTGKNDPVEALLALSELGPERVGLTLGGAGVFGYAEEKFHHLNAFEVAVLDTTGAGDAFHGGYAFARGSGLNFTESMDFANATAALKCRQWGGRLGLPTLEEVKILLLAGTRRDYCHDPWFSLIQSVL